MGHSNFLGFALNKSKVLARNMSAHLVKSLSGNGEYMMALFDPAKSMRSKLFEDKVTDSVLLLDHAGHVAPVVVVDGGTTKIKGIRSLMSMTRTNKHKKGNSLELKSHEKNFTIDGKKFALSCIPRVTKT